MMYCPCLLVLILLGLLVPYVLPPPFYAGIALSVGIVPSLPPSASVIWPDGTVLTLPPHSGVSQPVGVVPPLPACASVDCPDITVTPLPPHTGVA